MKRLIALIFAVAMLPVLAGCGSGGSGAATPHGSANITFQVKWPSAASLVAGPKLIPAAVKSYVISIFDQSPTVPVAQQVINFPATTASFTGLPVGTLTVVVKAYAVPVTLPVSGSLVPLATVTQSLVTQPGNNNTPPPLNLVSVIDHINVSPPASIPVTGGSISLISGDPAIPALVATPVDGSGNAVTINAGQIVWTSSNTSAATVNPSTGIVTPAKLVAGTTVASTTITATDPESKKTGTIGVIVTSSAFVTSTATITVNNPPPGTKSVVVALTPTGGSTAQQVGPITWQTPTAPAVTPGHLDVAFSQVNTPVNPQAFTVKVTAYANTTGTGTPLAVLSKASALTITSGTGTGAVDLAGKTYTLKVKASDATVDMTQLIQSPPASAVLLEVDLYDSGGTFVSAIDGSNATVKWSPATGSSTVFTASDGTLTVGTTVGGPFTVAAQDYLTGITGSLSSVKVISNQGTATGTVN